ncbi:Cytochrome b [Trichuris trichiura]|uniref:Cytochrome b n=1 Tax=Trichuris trichiura TaxID=36087 RepID=A0A077ZHW3_TRITR|nr:Cytochrome b [Trichuris trichiura]
MIFGLQLLSGLLLVFYYVPREVGAFDRIIFIMREVKYGFFLRLIHLNGASLIFILIYIHMAKALLNCSYRLITRWLTGNIILLLTILVAFMAATVITSFLSAIPIFGGFRIRRRTLQFFFTFHYLIPFVIIGIAIIHILFLHLNGRSNPLGSHSPLIKIKFYPFFTSKDLLNLNLKNFFFYLVLLCILFLSTFILGWIAS